MNIVCWLNGIVSRKDNNPIFRAINSFEECVCELEHLTLNEEFMKMNTLLEGSINKVIYVCSQRPETIEFKRKFTIKEILQ